VKSDRRVFVFSSAPAWFGDHFWAEGGDVAHQGSDKVHFVPPTLNVNTAPIPNRQHHFNPLARLVKGRYTYISALLSSLLRHSPLRSQDTYYGSQDATRRPSWRLALRSVQARTSWYVQFIAETIWAHSLTAGNRRVRRRKGATSSPNRNVELANNRVQSSLVLRFVKVHDH